MNYTPTANDVDGGYTAHWHYITFIRKRVVFSETVLVTTCKMTPFRLIPNTIDYRRARLAIKEALLLGTAMSTQNHGDHELNKC